MEKKTARLIKWVLLIVSFTALLIFSIFFYAAFLSSRAKIQNQNEYNSSDNALYHVIITGTYENQSFLTEVYKGAASLGKSYKTVVDLHVPESQADTQSLQDLLNYCSFLNADGIIVYIDSSEDRPELLQRSDSPKIPVITTGQFSPNMQQISFIGTNNWELGKKIADETQNFLPNGGNVYIISETLDTNSNTLISSIQSALGDNQRIITKVIDDVSSDIKIDGKNNIFLSLTEETTILSAQLLSEQFDADLYKLIGFGGNEVCQLYLQKGWISELVSLDPEKIGETAIRELLEYRTKGYANSYITADVKISKAQR
ncbi:MAG: substrate-binding domain-containing protein [Treponema sp.]|nr:substrate-binding domain-containing protein [Treponema sp.]MDY3722135.1 substrate-binding domain-containing protein [Treponema sp.]MDY5758998.1 substrate-binding domain-containing protein [Treponema sp.]MDY5819003.1 substrate-binding domain-containing protein [Treponema sp.]